MNKLQKRLEIISRTSLLGKARTIVNKNGTGDQARKSLLGLYRSEIERGSEEIESRFLSSSLRMKMFYSLGVYA